MNLLLEPALWILLIAFVLVIVIPYFIIQYERKVKFNYKIAADLKWYYSPFDLNLKKQKYLFFKAIRLRSSLDGFSGMFAGMDFRLFELGRKILAVEFRTRQKFYGIELISKNFLDLRIEGIFWKNKPVSLEGTEFNQAFAVYCLDPSDAFYELSPDEMAKLLDLKVENEAFGLEAQMNRALIYSHFPDYINYCENVRRDKHYDSDGNKKKEVLLKFMNFAYNIQSVLK